MGAALYWLVAIAVAAGLWMTRRELGIGKILLAAVFWPALIIVVPLLVYRRFYLKGRDLMRSLPGGSGGITPIPEGETYVASDAPASTPVLPKTPDVDIVIPTFGPISDQGSGEPPGPARP